MNMIITVTVKINVLKLQPYSSFCKRTLSLSVKCRIAGVTMTLPRRQLARYQG